MNQRPNSNKSNIPSPRFSNFSNPGVPPQNHSYNNGLPHFVHPRPARPLRENNTPQNFSPRGRGFSRGFRQSYNTNRYPNTSNNVQPHYGYQFYCDTCDRSFKDEAFLQKHLSEHVTCGLDGCTYVANAMAVSKHQKIQHSTGLFKKIKTTTPEDIAKWINERKRKFPTIEKVEKQRELNLERKARGETLDNNTRGRGRYRGSMRGNGRGGFRGKTRPQRRHRVLKIPIEIVNSNKEDWNGELPPFSGLNEIYGEEDESSEEEEEYIEDEMRDYFEDEEWLGDQFIPSKPVETKINNSLGALMSMYGSSDESDNEAPPITQKEKQINNITLTSIEIKQKPAVELVKRNFIASHKPIILKKEKENNTNVTNTIIEEKPASELVKMDIIDNEEDEDNGPEEIPIKKCKVANTVCEQQPATELVKTDILKNEADEDSGPEEIPIQICKVSNTVCEQQPATELVKTDIIKNEVDDDGGPEEIPIQICKNIPTENSEKETSQKRKRKRFSKGKNENNSEIKRENPKRTRRQFSVFEKLVGTFLKNEIRHERNILLQCVRHVVDNNFFGVAAHDHNRANEASTSVYDTNAITLRKL